MGVIMSGNQFVLDQEAETRIVNLAAETLRNKYSEEYLTLLDKFRKIVFCQEIANFKRFLETRHPEQVSQILRLREILNHERGT